MEIEYKLHTGQYFTEDGHTIFMSDVLRRLKRLAYLEHEIIEKRMVNALPTAEGECAVLAGCPELRNNIKPAPIAQQTLPDGKAPSKLPTDVAVELTGILRGMENLPRNYADLIEEYLWELD